MVEETELFPIVDEEGNTIGIATRQECHSGTKLLHPVVHLHIVDCDNRLYLQKRSISKDIQPGKWDTAVGGHVGPGEPVGEALRREANEELGITNFCPEFVEKYVFESEIEKELVHVYKTVYEGPIATDNIELDGGNFFTNDQIDKMIKDKKTTPNFAGEYKKFKKIIFGQ
jgi:isopentenyldiphosphate isomerase